MPVLHEKDIPAVRLKRWRTLTDDERNSIAEAVNDLQGDCTVYQEDIDISKLCGNNTYVGRVIHFGLFTDNRELPDGFRDAVTDVLLEADIATRVKKINIPCDPAGEVFHTAQDKHDYSEEYRAGIRIEGSWNTIKTVEH